MRFQITIFLLLFTLLANASVGVKRLVLPDATFSGIYADSPVEMYLWAENDSPARAATIWDIFKHSLVPGSAELKNQVRERLALNNGHAMDSPKLTQLVKKYFGLGMTISDLKIQNVSRRPLVILHDHAVFQWDLCRKLSSAGFLVVAIPMTGAADARFDITAATAEKIQSDIDRVITYTRLMGWIDEKNITIISSAFGGVGHLSYLQRNRKIKRFIGLDSGVLTPYDAPHLQRVSGFDPAQVTTTQYYLKASSSPSSNDFVRDYYCSTRHFLGFKLKEFELSSLSLIGSQSEEYARMINAIRSICTKDDPIYTTSGFTKTLGVEYTKMPAEARRISIKTLREIYLKQDFQAVRQAILSSSIKPGSKKYGVSNHEMTAFQNWLRFGGAKRVEDLLLCAEFRVDCYPDSARAAYARAAVYYDLDKAKGIAEYQRTLELLKTDMDPFLIPLQKKIMTDISTQRISS